jgi:hypothetical protein
MADEDDAPPAVGAAAAGRRSRRARHHARIAQQQAWRGVLARSRGATGVLNPAAGARRHRAGVACCPCAHAGGAREPPPRRQRRARIRAAAQRPGHAPDARRAEGTMVACAASSPDAKTSTPAAQAQLQRGARLIDGTTYGRRTCSTRRAAQAAAPPALRRAGVLVLCEGRAAPPAGHRRRAGGDVFVVVSRRGECRAVPSVVPPTPTPTAPQAAIAHRSCARRA